MLGDQLNGLQISVIGMGIVFIGLICLVIICTLMGDIFKGKTGKQPVAQSKSTAVSQSKELNIPNRQEFIAAVSAAIAEDLGSDISGIRIVSIKKL